MRPYNRPFGHRKAKSTQRWLVNYSRRPIPAVEIENNNQAPSQGGQIFWDQPLVITVTANTEAEAIQRATEIINTNIKGGQYIGFNGSRYPNSNLCTVKVGVPDIFTLVSVLKLKR
jgi:hypothetical protein